MNKETKTVVRWHAVMAAKYAIEYNDSKPCTAKELRDDITTSVLDEIDGSDHFGADLIAESLERVDWQAVADEVNGRIQSPDLYEDMYLWDVYYQKGIWE